MNRPLVAAVQRPSAADDTTHNVRRTPLDVVSLSGDQVAAMMALHHQNDPSDATAPALPPNDVLVRVVYAGALSDAAGGSAGNNGAETTPSLMATRAQLYYAALTADGRRAGSSSLAPVGFCCVGTVVAAGANVKSSGPRAQQAAGGAATPPPAAESDTPALPPRESSWLVTHAPGDDVPGPQARDDATPSVPSVALGTVVAAIVPPSRGSGVATYVQLPAYALVPLPNAATPAAAASSAPAHQRSAAASSAAPHPYAAAAAGMFPVAQALALLGTQLKLPAVAASPGAPRPLHSGAAEPRLLVMAGEHGLDADASALVQLGAHVFGVAVTVQAPAGADTAAFTATLHDVCGLDEGAVDVVCARDRGGQQRNTGATSHPPEYQYVVVTPSAIADRGGDDVAAACGDACAAGSSIAYLGAAPAPAVVAALAGVAAGRSGAFVVCDATVLADDRLNSAYGAWKHTVAAAIALLASGAVVVPVALVADGRARAGRGGTTPGGDGAAASTAAVADALARAANDAWLLPRGVVRSGAAVVRLE